VKTSFTPADRLLIAQAHGLGDLIYYGGPDWELNWADASGGIRFGARDYDGDIASCLVPSGWILNPDAWIDEARAALPQLRHEAEVRNSEGERLRFERAVLEFKRAGGNPAEVVVADQVGTDSVSGN
jgi:hypothetical protein